MGNDKKPETPKDVPIWKQYGYPNEKEFRKKYRHSGTKRPLESRKFRKVRGIE